jgi:hypothetical protein
MWLTNPLTDELEAAADAVWPGQDDCSGSPPVYNAATLWEKITQLLKGLQHRLPSRAVRRQDRGELGVRC